jgi:hypothetical protein
MHMRLPLLAITLLLAGCAHYFEPLGGATARLRFVSLPGTKTEISELAETRCAGQPGATIAIVGNTIKDGTNQGRSLAMPLQETVARPTASETRIRAGQPFAAQLKASAAPGPKGAGWDYPACTRSFVLTAKEGENYEAQLEQLHGGCQLNVFRITREKDGSYVRRVAENAHELKARCN